MKPTIVLVGRPNVGKSTLFNRLTRTRDALVADQPGLTRDRHYGIGRGGDRDYLVVDTAGFDPVAKDGIMHEMARQAEQAIAEADVLLFLVDGRAGRTPHDENIAARLRRAGRPVHLVVNKAEGLDRAIVAADFHALGLGDPLPVSAAHGDGVKQLIDIVLAPFPLDDDKEAREDEGPRVAIVGRPNVGKSTLVNTLLGEERVVAFDTPGNGMSDWPPEPMEIAGYSLAFADGIENMGLADKGPVDVFGYHTGTLLAAELGIARPSQVGRLVMSGIPFRSAEERRQRIEEIENGPKLTESGDEILAMQRNLWDYVVGRRDKRVPLDRAARIYMEKAKPMDRYWWPYRGVWTYEVKDRFPLISQPLLVIQPNVTTPDKRAGVQTGEMVRVTETGIENMLRTYVPEVTAVEAVL